jgi:hypothetical protein
VLWFTIPLAALSGATRRQETVYERCTARRSMGISGLLYFNCVYYTVLAWQEKNKAMRMRNQNDHNYLHLRK